MNERPLLGDEYPWVYCSEVPTNRGTSIGRVPLLTSQTIWRGVLSSTSQHDKCIFEMFINSQPSQKAVMYKRLYRIATVRNRLSNVPEHHGTWYNIGVNEIVSDCDLTDRFLAWLHCVCILYFEKYSICEIPRDFGD